MILRAELEAQVTRLRLEQRIFSGVVGYWTAMWPQWPPLRMAAAPKIKNIYISTCENKYLRFRVYLFGVRFARFCARRGGHMATWPPPVVDLVIGSRAVSEPVTLGS